jgi:hypothetical protein
MPKKKWYEEIIETDDNLIETYKKDYPLAKHRRMNEKNHSNNDSNDTNVMSDNRKNNRTKNR